MAGFLATFKLQFLSNESIVDQTVGSPKQIHFSQGNWIAIAVVMAAGWYVDANNDHNDLPIETIYSERPIIDRVVDKPIEMPVFGISITPTGGWTYLRVSGKTANETLNFVNESENLIAAIKPIVFREWPPSFVIVNEADADPAVRDPSPKFSTDEVGHDVVVGQQHSKPDKLKSSHLLDPIQYKSIVVEWFATEYMGHSAFRYGRIAADETDFFVRILAPQGPMDAHEAAITRLCDGIRPID